MGNAPKIEDLEANKTQINELTEKLKQTSKKIL